MPNIVYVLTNPVMPGLVKIGITDRDDVQLRMRDLYTTGVPLPFDCVVARQLEGVDAAELESALHKAFDPDRVNPSREFFRMDTERVEVLLRVMPGQDVTPRVSQQITELQSEDVKVASEYKTRQAQTNEKEFLESLSENGVRVYEKVLALGKREGMHINWGIKGFSLNVISNGARVLVCYGYPPSAFNQRIWTGFYQLREKVNIPEEIIENLKMDAVSTGLFTPAGSVGDLSCETDRKLDDSQLTALIGWLEAMIAKIREYESVAQQEEG